MGPRLRVKCGLALLAGFSGTAHAQDGEDWLTALAVGTTAYATTAVVHEVAGHGIGCLAAGSRPRGFSTTYMVCPEDALSPGALRFGLAAGPGANLLTGAAFASTLYLAPPRNGWAYHYLWTSTATNLLLSGGAMITGPWLGGDFGAFVATLPEEDRLGASIAFTVVGAGIISGTFPLLIDLADPMLGSDPVLRKRRARVTSWVPYFGAGVGLMSGVAALHKEQGPANAAPSILAYGLGTLYLAYLPLMIPAKPPADAPPEAPSFKRSAPWIAVGVGALGTLVALGYGIGDLQE